MRNIEEFGIRIPEILLPKKIDLASWSVIACDQYTQDLDYWKKAEKAADGKVSTLNLILPEVYLNIRIPISLQEYETINRRDQK